MKFQVVRSKWWRGQKVHGSKLLRTDGKMCCLGFRAIAAGHTLSEIYGVSMPATVPNRDQHDWRGYVDDFRISNSFACQTIADTNDDPTVPDAERERMLASMFLDLGDEVEFVD